MKWPCSCPVAAVVVAALLTPAPPLAVGTTRAAGTGADPAGVAGTGAVPAALLLTPADLPTGYVSDDALENADATARLDTYDAVVAAGAFAAYRTRDAAVVQQVVRLRDRADAALVVAHEATAVARARDAARLTVTGRYGDGPALAYQERGTRGEVWVMIVIYDGPYVSALGVYERSGEQAAIDRVQGLAAIIAARLRAAVIRAPAATSRATSRRPEPALGIISLRTSTERGRLGDTFRPHSTVSWRVVWHVWRGVPARARETLREDVWGGGRVLYVNTLTDHPYGGANALADHARLGGVAPGRYGVTVTVTIGRFSARATHPFQVIHHT